MRHREIAKNWGECGAVKDDCGCPRAREGLHPGSHSPALLHSMFKRDGGGVDGIEVGGTKLEATQMMTMMTLTVPTLQTPIGDPDLDCPPTNHGPLF